MDIRITSIELLGKQSFSKTLFRVRVDRAEKVQKLGKDERTQEDYQTSAKICSRCLLVVLHSFIFALLLSFFQLHQSLSEIQFQRNFFP